MAAPHIPLPINIEKWREIDHGLVVEKFVVTVVWVPKQYEDPHNPQSKQLVHWRGGGAYKHETSVKGRSTSFDTCKMAPNPEVEVQLISKDFMVSSQAVDHWEVPLKRRYTTTDFYNLIRNKRLNRFVYNGNGSGCLTWTTRLVEVLESEQVLPAGARADLQNTINRVRANPKCWVPVETGAAFY